MSATICRSAADRGVLRMRSAAHHLDDEERREVVEIRFAAAGRSGGADVVRARTAPRPESANRRRGPASSTRDRSSSSRRPDRAARRQRAAVNRSPQMVRVEQPFARHLEADRVAGLRARHTGRHRSPRASSAALPLDPQRARPVAVEIAARSESRSGARTPARRAGQQVVAACRASRARRRPRRSRRLRARRRRRRDGASRPCSTRRAARRRRRWAARRSRRSCRRDQARQSSRPRRARRADRSAATRSARTRARRTSRRRRCVNSMSVRRRDDEGAHDLQYCPVRRLLDVHHPCPADTFPSPPSATPRPPSTARRSARRSSAVELPDVELYLKLEVLQPIGSFKIRGAYNVVRQLTPAQLARRRLDGQRRQRRAGRRVRGAQGRRALLGDGDGHGAGHEDPRDRTARRVDRPRDLRRVLAHGRSTIGPIA